MTGVLSVDDLMDSSTNDGGSTDTETSDSDDSFKAVCEQLGADYDHAKAYIDEHGNRSDFVQYAERLLDDEEHRAIMASYRRGNCINRFIRKYLRNHEKDFTAYSGAFYGDSDNPDEGTYNHVQQRAREDDGNLMWYQALFPEPVAEYWQSEPVLLVEFDEIGYGDGMQDTHIFVERDWVEEYSDHTMTVENGQEVPRPPANDELSDSNGSSLPVDPSDFTVEDLRDKLDELLHEGTPSDTFAEIEAAEQDGKDRKTAVKAIRGAKNEAASREDGDQQQLSDAAKAGEMNAAGADIPPEQIVQLMEEGWTKEEIIAFYG